MADPRICPKCHLSEPDAWWISSSGLWCGPCIEQLRNEEFARKQASMDRWWWLRDHDTQPEGTTTKRYVVRRPKE